MGKKNSIENRVYLFDTLAGALLSGPTGELLASAREGDRIRARRALAEVAYMSCVLADTAELDAETVRDKILGGAPGPAREVEAAAVDAGGSPSRKDRKKVKRVPGPSGG